VGIGGQNNKNAKTLTAELSEFTEWYCFMTAESSESPEDYNGNIYPNPIYSLDSFDSAVK